MLAIVVLLEVFVSLLAGSFREGRYLIKFSFVVRLCPSCLVMDGKVWWSCRSEDRRIKGEEEEGAFY